jgi:hypothetical protein
MSDTEKAARVKALEDAQQACRYALKHQSIPLSGKDYMGYVKGLEVCTYVTQATIQRLIDEASK